MTFTRALRLPALCCAMALLVCELISRPFVGMSVSDDWSYIRTAQHLAETGHIVYNGWAAAIVGWQLYVGAAMIKLFGFSFTAPRMGVLLIAMVTAFVFQRLLVRTGLSETNATFGTLALVVSPLYMMLSVTFMTDIPGLFAVVVCFYCCVRAVQAGTSNAALGWICLAVLVNAVCGTSRQIAWLGVLVMVPSTLYLLRDKRRVLLAGGLATLLGMLFVFVVLNWFTHQPYVVPELPHATHVSLSLARWSAQQFVFVLLNLPFLLLPVFALFLATVPRIRKPVLGLLIVLDILYLAIAYHRRNDLFSLLIPVQWDWVTRYGGPGLQIQGQAPLFLSLWAQLLLTAVTMGCYLIFLSTPLQSVPKPAPVPPALKITRRQLGWITAPFAAAYLVLLLPRSTGFVFDRYTLSLLVVAIVWLMHIFQERVFPQVPRAAFLLTAALAVYGVASTHNLFALYRARVDLVNEMQKAGVPETSVNNGWEYNMDAEVRYAPSINFSRIRTPANAYQPAPYLEGGPCPSYVAEMTPHIIATYSVSYDPNACAGPAGIPPVHYSRWLNTTQGTLYVVRRTPDVPVIGAPPGRLP